MQNFELIDKCKYGIAILFLYQLAVFFLPLGAEKFIVLKSNNIEKMKFFFILLN